MSKLRQKKQERGTLFGLALVTALRMLGFSLVLPVFVLYGHELSDSPFLVGLALGAYGITQAIFQVPFGMLSDRWGRKPLLLLGLFLFGCGSLLGIAPVKIAIYLGSPESAIYILILCRLLQGAGAITAIIFAFVADIIPAERRSVGMAWVGMPIGIAMSAGIILGPILGSSYGFGFLFVLTSILVALAFCYCLFFVKEPPRHLHHEEVELNTASLIEVLPDSRLLRLDACGFITDFLMTALFFILPLIMAEHLAVKQFWRIYAPMLIFGLIVMFIGSRLADRGLSRYVFVGAYLSMGTGFACLSQAGIIWLLLASLFIYSGVSILHPVMPSTVTKLVPRRYMGTATGVFNFFLYLGAFCGGSSSGYLSDHWGRNNLIYLMVSLSLLAAFLVGTLNDLDAPVVEQA